MTTNTPSEFSAFGYFMKGLIAKLVFLAPWLWAAGRWDWFWPWLYTALFVVFDLLCLLFVDHGLLQERASSHPDAKSWDRRYVLLAAVLLPVLSGVVAGLDLRFGWSGGLSLTAQIVATFIVMVGFFFVGWSMWANAYFSAVVRIQSERGHRVISDGPYRIVRHPGYVGAILFTVAMPVMFGSVLGLIPAVLAAVVYVVRTKREDDTLQEELPGYREFAQKTRYRLFPGFW